jgi:hypothetical protein
MVFAHRFKMEFLGAVTGGVLNVAPSGTPFYSLDPGEVGLFPTTFDGLYGNAITAPTAGDVTLAAGSWMEKDLIAPFMGGYQESAASKRIQMSLVTRFVYDIAHAARQQLVAVGWDMSVTGATDDIGPKFFCGQTYQLKIQVLGNPAFLAYNKSLYMNFDAWGGCCGAGCSSGCTSDYTDPVCIFLQWKDRIYQTPNWAPTSQWSGFIAPRVFWNNGGVKTEAFSAFDVAQGRGVTAYTCDTTSPELIVAGMEILVAYTDTVFGTCTWSYSDSYNVEPAYVQASLVSQTGDPCEINTTINTSVPNMFTELVSPLQIKGSGNAVIKGLITSGNYRQELFADGDWTMSLRMREIEGNNVVGNVVSNSSLWDKVVIEHSVPRVRNSSSIYDTDVYSLIMHVPNGTNVSQFTTLFGGCLSLANSNVTLETLS